MNSKQLSELAKMLEFCANDTAEAAKQKDGTFDFQAEEKTYLRGRADGFLRASQFVRFLVENEERLEARLPWDI